MRVPKHNSLQERSASSSCMAARSPSHGRRPTQSSMEPKRPSEHDSELRQPQGRVVGSLEIEHDPAPTASESAAAPWAMTSPQSGTCDRAYVDRIASTSLGNANSAASACTRLTLLQPLRSIRRWAWASIASVRSTPMIRPSGTDRVLDQREVLTGAAGDVDDGVAGAKPECFHGPAALGPLRVAGHGVEPGDDVVVLRLLAVGLDQVRLRAVDLAHRVLLERTLVGATSPLGISVPPGVTDSTAALIAAISMSITR